MKYLRKNVYAKIINTVLIAGLLVVPLAVVAQSADEDTIINANIGSTISITTSGTVNLNVTPTASGSATSAADTVTVATNDSDGYTLVLEMEGESTDLENGSDDIPAHAGTQGTPTTLANNTWGYRVASVGGFGAGNMTPQSNQENLAGTFAGVPENGSPNTIKTTSAPTSGDATTVLYGVKADTSNPDGTYTNTVVYTATANP